MNHAKYIVTDNRLNIGTSNLAWGYFWNAAGTSFNTDHEGLRASAQRVLDRDWASGLAKPLAQPLPPVAPASSASADSDEEEPWGGGGLAVTILLVTCMLGLVGPGARLVVLKQRRDGVNGGELSALIDGSE